jgi:Skp family chaperone for outer membrane proteins
MSVKTLIQSMLVVGLGLLASGSAVAQDVQANQMSSAGAIVVLDVAKVFKSNAQFNQQIEAIQAEAEKLKSDVESRQQQLRAQAQNISETLQANSTERKDAEAQLEQDMTALRTTARQAEADLMAREAKVYYDTYAKMQSIVTSAAEKYSIALVLRFDSSEIDPANRNSVVNGVNRAIVFQKDRDLTGYVIEQMDPGANTIRSADNASGVQR